jgi:outer membrane protein, multidrug efflux system
LHQAFARHHVGGGYLPSRTAWTNRVNKEALTTIQNMHASRSKKIIVTSLIALSVSACSLQSDYVAPTLSNQTRWNTEAKSRADTRVGNGAASDTWWSALNDPAINALVDATFAGNPTLDKALARLDEARAQAGANRADYFPTLSAKGSITESNTKINNSGSGGGADAASSTGVLVGRSRTTAVGPSLTWELDLFGRVRSSVAASRRRLDARTADAQSTRLALAAQVATTTLDWRACAHSVEVDTAEIDSREKTLTLTQRKLAAGFAARVEVASVTRDLAAARNTLVAQQETCARNVNALVELSNLDRDALLQVLMQPLPNGDAADAANVVSAFMPTPPASTPELPATVLLAHPSVMAADREAAAAWAEIGVARADRFPKIDLSAALTGQWIRYAGSTLSLTTWSVTPAIAGTLFDFGKGANNVNAAQARYRQAAADLQATVRTTVKEVENALAAQQSAAARLDSSQQSAAAAQVVLNATQAKWDNGTASLFELEDAHRQYAIATDSVITAARDRASAWVELIRASANNLTSDIPSTSNSTQH